MTQRVYCNGELTKEERRVMLARKLDEGLVCTDYIVGGQGGILTKQKNDVAYFREGTPAELEWCRKELEKHSPAPAPKSAVEELDHSRAASTSEVPRNG